jgi:TatD DNase family protein
VKPALFDTHCHLGGDELNSSAQDLVERACAHGVRGFALISADEKSLHQVFAQKETLEKKYNSNEALFAASAGIHPHDAQKCDDKLWREVEKYAVKANAIGETVLDFYYNHSDKESQENLFRKHIQLSLELKKPLVIHCRSAATEILAVLNDYKKDFQNSSNPGILHCFTESWDMAKAALDMGIYISISGIVTFKNAHQVKDVASKVPMDRLLVETDSPFFFVGLRLRCSGLRFCYGGSPGHKQNQSKTTKFNIFSS